MQSMNNEANNHAVAQAVNEARAAGKSVKFNGHEVAGWTRGREAKVWNNGSVSVSVRARTTKGFNEVWCKAGQSCRVEVA